MKSLRVKMMVLLVLVVLVSTGLFLVIGYQRARNSLSSQLEANYATQADKYAQELTAWVNNNATIIDTMSADIAVNGIYNEPYETFHSYLNESCRLLNQNGYIFDIYFTYPDNNMACASDFIADGSVDYVHDRDWYTVPAATRELFYSSPYRDSDSGKPIVTISKAVYTGDTLQGVLAADIFVDTLVDIISRADISENGYAFLVDQNLGMIAHPNKDYDYDDEPRNVTEVSGAMYSGVISNILSGSRSTVYVKDYDGDTRGIVVSKMADTGWYVGIATSKDELLMAVHGLIRGFLIAAVIAVLIGASIAVVLALVLEKLNRQQREYEAQVLKLEKQAADEASRAKSRFLADMSHEIRTPINAIMGMNEMILRETDSGEISEYARNIKQSGHNLLQLINSILDFSKIEDGKMDIIPADYNLSSQIGYYVNGIAARACAKSLDFCLNIDPALPTGLHGDEVRINQIIMNLLTNAIKYTEKGSVTLTITAKERRSEPEDAVLLYVEVKDTGIGIKESDMQRLFESFERLDEVRNRSVEGTGLGMAITARLLSLMGSELKVESTYGVGSVFSFELWQKITDDTPLGDYKTAAPADDEYSYHEAFRAPLAHILVVDDTKLNIMVVVNLLKKTQIQVDTAQNGFEAVRLADENAYDVILMDQRMPEMDGTETMKHIRAVSDGKNAKTPIICLTADGIRGAKDRYISEGFDDYLTKPVEGIELENMLLKYIPAELIIRGEASPERAADTDSQSQVLPAWRLKDETITSGLPENRSEDRDLSLLDALAEAGVDTEAGMKFCQNDEDMYRAVLAEYGREEDSRTANLENSFAARDWKNYEIYIHALKSSSRMIGASELSDLALELETAAGRQDCEAVQKSHKRVMDMYRKVAGIINNNMEPSDRFEFGEDEVIEFPPMDPEEDRRRQS